jgi:hydroxymethylbilane synthase
MRLRLGTRGSRLARTQSEWVARRLEETDPTVAVELVEIRTSGDRIQDVPLGPHLGQSFFTREIEVALIEGRVDLAVHSCKDLATVSPSGLRIGALPEREDPRDALVSARGSLRDLPEGARIGTSSPRRKGFLAAARPDLSIVDQRGNVPTRLQAVEEGTVDAVVLAVAGLRRLGLAGVITETLSPALMLPAASQGALALQVREDDERVAAAVSSLDHSPTRAGVTAERACLRGLEAGCQAPVGALASVDATELRLSTAVVTPDGIVWVEERGAPEDAERIGTAAAGALLTRLGLRSLRDAAWAGAAPLRFAEPRGGPS